MRTPIRWTRPSQTSLYALCLCGAPAAVANNSIARIGDVLLDRQVLTLLVIGCLVGMIAGWIRRHPREPRVRLLNKPKKTPLSILVPPGPAPRLIPSDSPKVTRPRSTRAPVPRQTPVGAARPRVINYIAAFADSAEASERDRVDYLL
jgi:hypothetical protein